jgi:hypothetical protein
MTPVRGCDRRESVVLRGAAVVVREMVDQGNLRGFTPEAAFVLCRALEQAAQDPGGLSDRQYRRCLVVAWAIASHPLR